MYRSAAKVRIPPKPAQKPDPEKVSKVRVAGIEHSKKVRPQTLQLKKTSQPAMVFKPAAAKYAGIDGRIKARTADAIAMMEIPVVMASTPGHHAADTADDVNPLKIDFVCLK